jgi:hypothetical protein
MLQEDGRQSQPSGWQLATDPIQTALGISLC